MASATGESRKFQNACLVCRSRKVRCDRALPGCDNCGRLGVSCPGYDTENDPITRSQMIKSTENIFKAAGKEQRRIGSCESCRASKSHCSRTRPACKRCMIRSLRCVYRPKSSKQSTGSCSEVRSRPSISRDISIRAVMSTVFGIEHEQLYSETLPTDLRLRSHLITLYFERVHPLRCMAFIHRPSFMHALDHESVVQNYGEPLLYSICALGARILFLDSVRSQHNEETVGRAMPGSQWAEMARKDVLLEAHIPTIQRLMTMLLLCEYGLRADQNSLVFILTGHIYRSIRLLGLDMAQRPSVNTSDELLRRETERRIVWACYHLDLLITSGVDKNSMWREDLPLIPLPCPDQDFLSLTRSPPYLLAPIVEGPDALPIISQFDLPSLSTVLIRHRNTALKLIRAVPSVDNPIWDSSSALMTLVQQLETFRKSLPDRFHLTELNMYMQKDQHTLGAVFFLHLVYHAAMFDLTRISLAGFNFPLAAAFRDAPADFQSDYQQRCHFHATEVSKLIRKGLMHDSAALDQPLCDTIALESAKIQIIYSATVANNSHSVETTTQNLRTTLELLRLLHAGREGQNPHTRTLLPLCTLFGFGDIAEEWRESQLLSDSEEVTGSPDVYHLCKFALFRKARAELQLRSPTCEGQRREPPVLIAAGASRAVENEPQHSNNAEQHPDHPETTNLDGEVIWMPIHDAIQPRQPSVEDYIRTADDMGEFLTWDGSGPFDAPWISFNF